MFTQRLLGYFDVIVFNSVFCLNCDCVLITSLYQERFYASLLDSHCYIRNIVISKIVLSGFCPIHFAVTFAGTQNVHQGSFWRIVVLGFRFPYISMKLLPEQSMHTHCYTGNVIISRIVVSGFHCIRIEMIVTYLIQQAC